MNNAQAPIDPTFIVQVQIAIIGIILVCGLFYIWRTVCRIEEKIDRMRSAPPPVPAAAPVPLQTMHFAPQQMCPMMGGYDEVEGDDDAAEALMKSVFGDVFAIHNPVCKASNASNTGVEVTDIEEDSDSEGYEKEEDKEPSADVIETVDAEGEGEGEVETESVGGESIAVPGKLSKTKLKAMSVNMLKELCSQRGLSTEGAKPALITTLLAA
jgi:hypothetical protein